MWPFSSNTYPEFSPRDVGVELLKGSAANQLPEHKYDYIVVGGGTAGCVVASRLSENPNCQVLLVERGGVYDTWANRVPLISADAYTKHTIAKKSKSLPISSAAGRTVELIYPEVLGGGSRVNAMIYTRGFPGEYNVWEEHMGRSGWNFERLKLFFSKSEHSLSQKGDSRGRDGPLENQTFPNYESNAIHHVRDAASALNIPFTPDINSPNVSSVSLASLDIAVNRKMQRASSFNSYLPHHVAQTRPNLKVCTNTVVTRIVFAQDNGEIKADGVEMRNANKKDDQSKLYFAKATKEVILCCGALASPQVLMLSGIGPQDHLKQHGIDVVVNSPGVGSKLKDHVDLPIMWTIPLRDSLHVLIKKPLVAIIELIKYLLSRPSLFSSPFVHIAFFLPSRLLSSNGQLIPHGPTDLDISKPENVPDLELKAIPVSGVVDDPKFEPPNGKGIFTFMTCLLRPKSIGSVRLTSADPYDRPKVDLNFFSAPEDLHVLGKGVKLAKRLAEQIRKQGYPFTELLVPQSESDEDINQYIRERARTTYHYSCTCRMGTLEEGGVVDDELRVWGIQGLRVADTSVFPEIIAAHTMAPAIMVAERCADFIKTAWSLANSRTR